MAQALSNLSISFPLYSSNKTSKFCHLPFAKLQPNKTSSIKAMAGESRENLDHLQRASKPQQQSQPNRKRVGAVAPIGLWDRFPTARTVQQMMETMERMMEDPFVYSGTWPSPLPSENNNYSRGRTPWEIKEGEGEYKMRFDMPGMTKEDVKVWVEEKMLVVKAEKAPKKKKNINGAVQKGEQEEEEEEEEWSAKSYGRYSSRIALPENVQFEKIKAEVKDGVLYITIPKASNQDVSREAKEVEPIRALTESVSFGRFMSESLAWEKWSTFSHNRYLEEVEKFSKPGSVAEKKAYFEAHYKRRAEMRAAALLEQANTIAANASQMETSSAEPIDSSLNIDSANANALAAIDEEREKDVLDAEVVNCGDVYAGNLNVERDTADFTVSERDQAAMDTDVNVENDQGMIMATPDKKIVHMESSDQKNLTSSSKKRSTNSMSKSSTPSRVPKAPKLPLPPSKRLASGQARCDTGVVKSIGNSNDKKKTTPNSLHMSISFASGASKTSKMPLRMPKDSTTPLQTPTRTFKKAADQENLAPSSEKRHLNSTFKLSNHGGVPKQVTPRVGNNHALINKKSAVDSTEQRRVVQKSLHMSMNFTPNVAETNKTSLKISKDSSAVLQTPTRASINGGSKHPSNVLQSQDRRSRAVLNKSVSGGITGEGRWPSVSNCSKSSSTSVTSAQSPIASSPFRFRSEERAAKRKEASLTATFFHAIIVMISNFTKSLMVFDCCPMPVL
ncbi:hypothetical protein COLO4_23563 [Corchorus olitorius]|uniref:SHSP domain-containing protein n=1 Tax=Corchorus olitorius TaxID=93759 RepID=A0A1R3IFV6_9ROSI|nr:hypothetical protein COLO4_23563 [Corchorus olitorius]